jgi:hypothetical protein
MPSDPAPEQTFRQSLTLPRHIGPRPPCGCPGLRVGSAVGVAPRRDDAAMTCPDCGGDVEAHLVVDAGGGRQRCWCRDCGREVDEQGQRVGDGGPWCW